MLLARSRSGPYQLYLTFKVQRAGWVKLIQKNRRKCDEKSWRMNDVIVESLTVNNTLAYEPHF